MTVTAVFLRVNLTQYQKERKDFEERRQKETQMNVSLPHPPDTPVAKVNKTAITAALLLVQNDG